MNSLKRLQIYNDSDSDDDKNEKSRERLPVPEFCEIPSKKKLMVENINHEGKVRSFPHEPGNWASYIYLPIEPSPELSKYVNQLAKFLEPLKLKLVDDFHISLTKTVILKHHWIQDFVNSVKERLKNFVYFKIQLYNLKVYCNEQKNRTFLSLKVEEGEENLKEIVSEIDNCLRDYKLQTFYENPSFHLSLFWSSGDRRCEINKFIHQLPSKLETFSFLMTISHCICSSGNKKFTFILSPTMSF